jgi:hypothetical protein
MALVSGEEAAGAESVSARASLAAARPFGHVRQVTQRETTTARQTSRMGPPRRIPRSRLALWHCIMKLIAHPEALRMVAHIRFPVRMLFKQPQIRQSI